MKRFQIIMVAALLAFATFMPATSSAQSMTDYLENKVVDWLFRAQSFSPPSDLYISLHTSGCSDSSPGTEMSGGDYARVEVESALASWAGTQSAGSTTASSGTGGQTSNNAALTFPAPDGANWGTITHFGIFDAPTSGNMWICQALTASKTVNDGDAAPAFAIGALTVTFQ